MVVATQLANRWLILFVNANCRQTSHWLTHVIEFFARLNSDCSHAGAAATPS